MKKLITLTLAAVLLLSLAACGMSSKDSGGNTDKIVRFCTDRRKSSRQRPKYRCHNRCRLSKFIRIYGGRIEMPILYPC